jgi:hypothetical protein
MSWVNATLVNHLFKEAYYKKTFKDL